MDITPLRISPPFPIVGIPLGDLPKKKKREGSKGEKCLSLRVVRCKCGDLACIFFFFFFFFFFVLFCFLLQKHTRYYALTCGFASAKKNKKKKPHIFLAFSPFSFFFSNNHTHTKKESAKATQKKSSQKQNTHSGAHPRVSTLIQPRFQNQKAKTFFFFISRVTLCTGPSGGLSTGNNKNHTKLKTLSSSTNI